MSKVFRICKGKVWKYLDVRDDLRNGGVDLVSLRVDGGCKKCVMSHEGQKYMEECLVKVNKAACGCDVDAKSRVYDEWCPFGVWGREWLSEDALKELNRKNNFVKNT